MCSRSIVQDSRHRSLALAPVPARKYKLRLTPSQLQRSMIADAGIGSSDYKSLAT